MEFPQNFLIHIVDDDEAVRESLGALLTVKGADVRTYASGPLFLERGSFPLPSCLLLDLQMPEMTGFELLAALKERQIDIPVIILTGNGGAVQNSSSHPDVRAVLQKPAPLGQILAAIQDTFSASNL